MALPTTLERLRILDAIAVHGTIAGAARTLGYTPSAVSQHLATLEREAATSLVERSNRGVALTPAGRRLAERAGEILDSTRTAFDEIDVTTDRHTRSVVIAAFPTAVTEILLPLRRRLAPHIDLTIVEAESEVGLRAVTERRVDAAITDAYAHQLQALQLQAGPNRLERTPLWTEAIRLVGRPDRITGDFALYAASDWVIGSPDGPIGHALRRLCHDAGFVPKVIALTDDHRVTFDVIRQTGAVSLLPALALVGLPDDIAIDERVHLPLDRRIEFVTRPSMSAHPAIVECTRLLRAQMRFA